MKKESEEIVTIELLKNKVNTYMKKDWPLINKAYSYYLLCTQILLLFVPHYYMML